VKAHRARRRRRRSNSPASRLEEAERLFADFRELTPYAFRPFVKTFATFEAYERWKRAQQNPWYR
jgi:hypothetical protein